MALSVPRVRDRSGGRAFESAGGGWTVSGAWGVDWWLAGLAYAPLRGRREKDMAD